MYEVASQAFLDELEKISSGGLTKREQRLVAGGAATTGAASGAALALYLRGRQKSGAFQKSVKQTKRAQNLTRSVLKLAR